MRRRYPKLLRFLGFWLLCCLGLFIPSVTVLYGLLDRALGIELLDRFWGKAVAFFGSDGIPYILLFLSLAFGLGAALGRLAARFLQAGGLRLATAALALCMFSFLLGAFWFGNMMGIVMYNAWATKSLAGMIWEGGIWASTEAAKALVAAFPENLLLIASGLLLSYAVLRLALRWEAPYLQPNEKHDDAEHFIE